MVTMTEASERKTYTVLECVAALNCSRAHFYALCEAGEVPGAVRIGSRWHINRVTFDRWINGELARAS